MAHLPDSQFTDSSMDYLAAVLRGEGLAMPEPTCDQRLVLLCLNELDTLARLIAVTGSTANAIATGRAKHDLGPALIAFLPPPPKTCAMMLNTDSGASLPLPVLTALQVFEVKIAAAKDMTRAVVQQNGDKGGVHIATVADAWRELSRDTRTLRAHLADCAEADALSGLDSRANGIDALLHAVSNGNAPCLAEDGSVEIPGWAERRRHTRFAVNWTAQLLFQQRAYVVRVVDISAAGAAVTGRPKLMAGDWVYLTLEDGVRRAGEVRWVKGENFGLSFAEPINADSPLLLTASSK